jgi:hypothetical protein
MKKRSLALLMAAIFAVSSLCLVTVQPVQAANKEKLYRYGTYIGGATALYGLMKGKGTLALIGGGLGLLSYTQWKKQQKSRHREASLARYQSYRRSWLARNKGRRVYSRR